MRIGALLLILGVSTATAQMAPDPDFDATVAHPTYTAHHPRVAIDQGHDNVHTKDGLFKPFSDLLHNDGYDVVAITFYFSPDHMKGIDVLVIANATGKFSNDNNDSTPAFTKAECDAVYEWVRQGGSLFLAADHFPMGDAAAPLAQRFGVTLGNGFVVDSNPDDFTDDDPTELVFSDQNHLLGDHSIIRGRGAAEQVHRLVAFTGESVSVPAGGAALLILSPTTGEILTRKATLPLYDADPAKARANREAAAKQWPVRGRAMAIAFPVGRGRVVVSGEVGMLTAQVFKKTDKNGVEKIAGKMGMDVPGNDDRLYVLNVLHWLSRALK
ncbi:MAG: hypothetical protein WCA13_13270 [Terriglobales bacterium]